MNGWSQKPSTDHRSLACCAVAACSLVAGSVRPDATCDDWRAVEDETRGRFDVAMVWTMDRLGHSLADLIDTLRVLEAAKVDLYLDQQAIDTTTPAGRATGPNRQERLDRRLATLTCKGPQT